MKDGAKLRSLLKKRKEAELYRSLRSNQGDLIDFASNDYLGLARDGMLKSNIIDRYTSSDHQNGSTGSRLITGNNELVEETESILAEFFQQSASTIFSSGYMANLAYFSSVPQKGDTIIYDELAHACIKDGARLSHASRYAFRHNNLEDLALKLKKAEGQKFIAIESVYSMDGDFAPIEAICNLAEAFDALVIVDEAHSTGIWGEKGEGLVQSLNLADKVSAVIYTFGKAMGIHGACIAGSKELKSFIINFARPFIYTTAPSDFELLTIQEAFTYRQSQPALANRLFQAIDYFNAQLPEFTSASAIKSVIIGGNTKTKSISNGLINSGLDIRAILSPTVKTRTERLRICLHSFNTEKEIDFLCDRLKLNCPELFG